MAKTKILTILLLSFLLLSISVLAQDNQEDKEVDLHLFYGKGCPHCGKAFDFLDSIKEKYPSLKIQTHEIYFDDAERDLFETLSESFGMEIQGVPTTFIDGKVIVGFTNAVGEEIEQEIQRCLKDHCLNPLDIIDGDIETTKMIGDSSPVEDPEKTKLKKKITIPAVISAAIVDAINPCAFAVLIILLTTILSAGVKKRVLMAGLAFTLSIYISYFLMGIGLYSAIQASGLTHRFYFVVAVLAIIIGLFNLKDYLWYGKWFIMEVPMSWRPKLKSLLKGVTSVPGAFLIGFVISLFLLPCTSGPYIVILGLLAKTTTQSYALMLLILYNLIFILPMLIITLAVYFGFTTTEKAEEWRTKRLEVLHLIAGIIILCLGIGMLIAMKLGMI